MVMLTQEEYKRTLRYTLNLPSLAMVYFPLALVASIYKINYI